MKSIARFAYRRRWYVLGGWVALLVALFASSAAFAKDFTTEFKLPGSESQDAIDLLEEKGVAERTGIQGQIVFKAEQGVDDPAVRESMESLFADIQSNPEIEGLEIVSPYEPGNEYHIADNGQIAYAELNFSDRDYGEYVDAADVIRALPRENVEGLQVEFGGDMFADEPEFSSEYIGILAAIVILLIAFGSVIAMGLPIITALFGIGAGAALVTASTAFLDMPDFTLQLAAMIGIGVGIDYALLIVSRYRDGLRDGLEPEEAVVLSLKTSGRAVLFAGMTVVIALLGMLIIPANIFRSLAAGAILVTLASLAASMTLLPAILGLLGDRVNWPRLARRARIDSDHDPKGGFWDRLSRRVMARPVAYLALSLAILGGLGIFTFQLNRGTSQNVSQLPDEFRSKQAFVTLEREFAGGVTDPARIVITGDVESASAQAALGELQQAVAESDAFAQQTQVTPSPDGTAVVVDVYFRGDPGSEAAFQGIRDLRSDIVPDAFDGVDGVEVFVGGNTAFFTDFLDIAREYQWIVLSFVLGLSFILLTVVFRSIVVPVKAIIMNLLSVGAAYGAVTLVFQEGVGIGFFNSIGFRFQQTAAIEAWLPLFLFSVLFGLSMDYHVFLLSRIREHYDKNRDNTEAVAYGLRTTAGIITGAALIMVAVFGGFAAGRLGPLQQMGFGLAVAVFMDATIVRSLLVPASMRLLGDWNWYLPRWLRWLPQVHVEGREPTLEVIEPERVPVAAER
jgi:RND superfamily putative drug exporter